MSPMAASASARSSRECAAETQKRTRGYVTGVAGAPTTTTASLRLNASREKSPILYGWYSITGITGEGCSPSTSKPSASRPCRKNSALSRSWHSFFAPMSVPSSPAMTRRDARICVHTAGGIDTASVHPALYCRTRATVSASPATYPPAAPKDLVKVPIMTSMSAGSTPSSSHTPRPVAPTAPMECASSSHTYAPYNLHTSTIAGSLHSSPSME
mmetsp:Transcript_5026/g.20143  ORF Transcript_5026/g.20143 Transcript_5026/m.20143 type:complete len:214 (-) Transcript_5026:1021-1662(-)